MVADEMLPAFHARTLALFTAEDGGPRLIGCRGYNPWSEELFDEATLTSPAAVGTLAAGVPAFFATVEELASAYPLAPRQDGLHAWAFLPLIASGRSVGLCVLAFDRPHPFSGNQQTVLTALSGLLAVALR